jgi:Domain of unknown function (DUF397)
MNEELDVTREWTRWRKASASANQGGNCVEVASTSNRIGVRDSKDRGGPVLGFTLTAWTNFLTDVREGRIAR